MIRNRNYMIFCMHKINIIMLENKGMIGYNSKHHAGVMELVDVLDSKSSAFGRAGSSPATGTKQICVCGSVYFIIEVFLFIC